MLSELESVMATALKALSPSERQFVYDMFGFHGRSVMSEATLKKKYALYGKGYTTYVNGIKRKLLGSRTLRSYIGKRNLFWYNKTSGIADRKFTDSSIVRYW